MSEPKRRQSGNMAALAYREKYISVSENTLPLLRNLNDRIDRLAAKTIGSTPVPPPLGSEPPSTLPEREDDSPDTLPEAAHTRDPRREPNEDSRRDDDIPIDLVEPDPFPEAKKVNKS